MSSRGRAPRGSDPYELTRFSPHFPRFGNPRLIRTGLLSRKKQLVLIPGPSNVVLFCVCYVLSKEIWYSPQRGTTSEGPQS